MIGKSSITLLEHEYNMVQSLKKKLGIKSNVEVIRRGLEMLQESLLKETLMKQYADASLKVREQTLHELGELEGSLEDGLLNEEDWDAPPAR